MVTIMDSGGHSKDEHRIMATVESPCIKSMSFWLARNIDQRSCGYFPQFIIIRVPVLWFRHYFPDVGKSYLDQLPCTVSFQMSVLTTSFLTSWLWDLGLLDLLLGCAERFNVAGLSGDFCPLHGLRLRVRETAA